MKKQEDIESPESRAPIKESSKSHPRIVAVHQVQKGTQCRFMSESDVYQKETVRKRNRTDKLFHVLDHLENIVERALIHESEYYG